MDDLTAMMHSLLQRVTDLERDVKILKEDLNAREMEMQDDVSLYSGARCGGRG